EPDGRETRTQERNHPRMNRFSDEHEQIRKVIRKWTAARLEPKLDALESGEPPYELMREFAKAFGIADLVRARFEKDKEPSGRALDPTMGTLVSLELTRVSPGFALAFGASTGLAGGAIMARGTPEQKRRWALPILTMEKIGAWGMTEPGAGSDAFGSM